MFFNISHKEQPNFPCHYAIKNLVISTDVGWVNKIVDNKFTLYKGYCDDAPLEKLLEQIVNEEKPQTRGNFCVIIYKDNKLEVKTNIDRSFPIFYDTEQITNLCELSNQIFANFAVSINEDLSIHCNPFDAIGEITENTQSYADVLEDVHEMLLTKVNNFVKHNTLPVKTFLSGGVDSMLVYSYVSRFTNVEVLDREHLEFDSFYLKNSSVLRNMWAYKQIHHWCNPTILTSGTPGDEYMLRNPETAQLFCVHYGKDLIDMLEDEQYKGHYHYTYFIKNIKKMEDIANGKNKLIKANKKYFINSICKNLLNDYQHFHLGNTLTYTPLRDLRIAKSVLQLNFDDAIGQITDAKLTRDLIAKNNPKLLDYISPQKNSHNPMENLVDFIIKPVD